MSVVSPVLVRRWMILMALALHVGQVQWYSIQRSFQVWVVRKISHHEKVRALKQKCTTANETKGDRSPCHRWSSNKS